MHLEQPKLLRVLAVLSAKGLSFYPSYIKFWPLGEGGGQEEKICKSGSVCRILFTELCQLKFLKKKQNSYRKHSKNWTPKLITVMVLKWNSLVSQCNNISKRCIWTGKQFLEYQIRISACFTWTDNSYLTYVISARTG